MYRRITAFAAAFAFVAIALPSFASASALTSSQISSILGLLQSFGADQSVISNVQVALGGAPSASTNSCYTFSTNLRVGMSGPVVTALQTALQKDGESVSITGMFDDQTASAVSGFQEKYASDVLTPVGLQHGTGYAGVSTRTKLNSLCVSGNQQTTQPVTPNAVSSTAQTTPTTSTSPTVTVTSPLTISTNAPVTVGGSSNTAFVTISGTSSSLAAGSSINIDLGTVGMTSSWVQSNGTWSLSFGQKEIPAGSYPFTIAAYSSVPALAGKPEATVTGTLLITPTVTTKPVTVSISRTPGFTAQTISPNTSMVKIGSFNIQTNSSGSYTVNGMSVSLNVSGYSITNISNLAIKSNGGYIGTPIALPQVGTNQFMIIGGITIPANSSKEFDIYADIGSATSGSVTANLSFYGDIASPSVWSTDGVAITSATTQPTAISTSPTITNIVPSQGTTGTTVTISGAYLDIANNITFYDSNNKPVANIYPSYTAYVSSGGTQTQFVINRTFATTIPAGTYQLRVTSPSGTSNQWPFTLIADNTPAPATSLTIAANPTNIISGQTSAISWNSVNATQCVSSGDGASWGWSGNHQLYGSVSTPPLTSTQTYTMSCTGAGGTVSKSVTVNVTL